MPTPLILDPADRPLVHAILAALAVQDAEQPAHLIADALLDAGVPLPANAKRDVVPRLLNALADAGLISGDDGYFIDDISGVDRFQIAFVGPETWLDGKLGAPCTDPGCEDHSS